MKKTKKILLGVTAAAMALQGLTLPMSAGAKTVIDSGNGFSIDFEEYAAGATPEAGTSSAGGWVYEQNGIPSGKTTQDMYKVKEVTGWDGQTTKALELSIAKDDQTTFDRIRVQYYADKPIIGDYIEASYDIYTSKPTTTGDNYNFLKTGFTLTDPNGKRLTRWSIPKAIESMSIYQQNYFYGFHEVVNGADNTNNNPRFSYMFKDNHQADGEWTAGEWVRVKKRYDMQNSQYTLYINGVKEGTYDMGVVGDLDVADAEHKIAGVSDFLLQIAKDMFNANAWTVYLDNISVKQYNPDLVSFDFEDDVVGAIPAGASVGVTNHIDSVTDTTTNTKVETATYTDSDFFNVVAVKGKDGKMTKALHFNSQPTEGVKYNYKTDNDNVFAEFAFDTIESDYVKVSYDVMMTSEATDDGDNGFSGGFYTVSQNEDGSDSRGAIWGNPGNREFVYRETPNLNWYYINNGSYKYANATMQKGKWSTITRIYDTKNKTAAIYVDGVLKVEEAPVMMYKNNTLNSDLALAGIKDFRCWASRSLLRTDKVEYYVDNITAEPVSYKYAPANYSYNFEADTVGELPAGTGWSFTTSTTGDQKTFFNVQEVTDKDGETTKALHYSSQPTTGTTYTYTDYSRAAYNFGNVAARFIKVGYDVLVKSDPAGGFKSGFVNINEDGTEEMSWGQIVNTEWIYYDSENGQKVANWKIIKDGGNLGGGRVFNDDGSGKWTRFERLYDTQSNTYTLYIDGAEKATNVPVAKTYGNSTVLTSDIAGVSGFQSIVSRNALQGGNNYEYYIDNISVEEIYAETPNEYWVSPEGSDSNDGETERYPFATIEKAKTAARNASAYKEEVIIHLMAGEYTEPVVFGESDSPLLEGGVIKYVAEDGAVFTGKKSIPSSAFTKTDIKAEAPVYVADISAYVSGEIPEANDYRHGQTDSALPMGVLQNGEGLIPARWPNYTYVETAESDPEITGTPTDNSEETTAPYTAKITVSEEQAEKWKNAPDMFVKGYFWGNWGFWGKNASISDGKIVFDKTDDYKLTYSRYAVTNLLEELDIPGEYYIDREAKKLYICPIDGTTEGIALATGTSAMITVNGAKNLVFDGIDVKYTNGAAYEIKSGSSGITIQDAEITEVYAPYAIVARGEKHTIDGLNMHNLPAGAIWLDGGASGTNTALVDGEFVHAGSVVKNCEIYNYARERESYYSAIDLRGCGNTATNNVIHDAPHFAIEFYGIEHEISYNEIYNVAKNSLDSGAIYSNNQWYEAGSVVKYNHIHDIVRRGVGKDMNLVSAIYIDDATSGITIEGNLIERCANGMHIAGGKGMVITNNIIADCTEAVVYGRASNNANESKHDKAVAFKTDNLSDESVYEAWCEKLAWFGDCFDDGIDADDYPSGYWYLPSGSTVKNNLVAGTNAESFEKASDGGVNGKLLSKYGADENSYEDNKVDASSDYTSTAPYTEISAELAKTAAGVEKTGVKAGALTVVLAEERSAESAELIWHNSTGIGRYELKIADNAEMTNAESYDTAENGAVVTGLSRGVTYYYTLTAYEKDGEALATSGSFEIAEVVLGNATANRAAAAGATVTFTLPTEKAEATTGRLIVAIKAGGTLVAAATDELKAGQSAVTVTIPEDAGDNLSAELYVWRTVEGMAPITEKITKYSVVAPQ